MSGPQLPASEQIHAMKYRGEGESFREAMNRVANALADNSQHYRQFRDIIMDQRFMPAGRVQAAMGAARQTTPYNCYVSGTIEDSFVDGDGSIMSRAFEAAATMRLGGGIGYDFSTLRPRGALIKKLRSHSTGPVSFMRIFNEVCLCTSSAGHRRGAQMGVLRIDHPDILEFIRAKQNTTELLGFNISVAVTDEFMDCLAAGRPFTLRFGGEVYAQVDAAELWEELMRSTWDWAEPGVLFIDRINKMNNLWYCEELAATNPCGEQPLPPFGACLLGSYNLPKYVTRQANGLYSFDMSQFREDQDAVVRAMDNVVDRALYPLPQQAEEARSKRRMGLGVTGLANTVEALLGGPSYGSAAFLEWEGRILEAQRDETYQASMKNARDKGAFPLFDKGFYLDSGFARTLPPELRKDIAKYGIRNSHLTSIAPTGTISFAADNVSSSIEPVFDYNTKRPVNTPDGPVLFDTPDYGYAQFGIEGKTTDRVTAQEHISVLTTAQRYVDSAVSKTCNVPGDMPWEDFKGIYLSAYEGGAKGCTTFNKDGKRIALLTGSVKKAEDKVEEPTGESCSIDPNTGRKSCE